MNNLKKEYTSCEIAYFLEVVPMSLQGKHTNSPLAFSEHIMKALLIILSLVEDGKVIMLCIIGSFICQRNLIYQRCMICTRSASYNIKFIVKATVTLIMFDYLRIIFNDYLFFIVIYYDL